MYLKIEGVCALLFSIHLRFVISLFLFRLPFARLADATVFTTIGNPRRCPFDAGAVPRDFWAVVQDASTATGSINESTAWRRISPSCVGATALPLENESIRT